MGANVSGAERAVTMKAGFDASTNVLRFSFHFTSTRSNYEFGLRNLRAETSLGTIYHGQASRPQASLKSGVIAFRMRRFPVIAGATAPAIDGQGLDARSHSAMGGGESWG